MSDKDGLLRIHSVLIETDALYGELWSTIRNKDSIEVNNSDEDKRLTFAFKPYKDSTKCVTVEVRGFCGDRRLVRRHFKNFDGRKALVPLRPAVIHKFVKLVVEAQRSTPDEVRERLHHYQRYIGVLRIGKHRYALLFDGKWRLLRYDRNAVAFEYSDQVARYLQRFEKR